MKMPELAEHEITIKVADRQFEILEDRARELGLSKEELIKRCIAEAIGRVGDIERTLELLKRDIIKGIEPSEREERISLFGSVKVGDITEEMIDEAKRSLFRDLEDI